MHLHLIILAQSTTSTTVAKGSKGSGNYYPLLIMIALFALIYVFFLRPRQQRLRQQQTQSRQLSVGDEVMSAGGIYGRVVALDADAVEVEVSPGVVMTFTKRAISARPQPPGGSRRAAAEPVDEPWNVGDGPGDTAAADTGPAPGTPPTSAAPGASASPGPSAPPGPSVPPGPSGSPPSGGNPSSGPSGTGFTGEDVPPAPGPSGA